MLMLFKRENESFRKRSDSVTFVGLKWSRRSMKARHGEIDGGRDGNELKVECKSHVKRFEGKHRELKATTDDTTVTYKEGN